MQSFNKIAHDFLGFLYRLLPDFTLMSPQKKVPEAIALVMSMFVFFMRLSYDYLYSRMVSFPLWLFCSPQMFLQWVNICIIYLHFCLPLFFLLSQAYQCRTIRSQMTCKQPSSGQVNITQFWKKALCRFCHSPRIRTVGFRSHLRTAKRWHINCACVRCPSFSAWAV